MCQAADAEWCSFTLVVFAPSFTQTHFQMPRQRHKLLRDMPRSIVQRERKKNKSLGSRPWRPIGLESGGGHFIQHHPLHMSPWGGCPRLGQANPPELKINPAPTPFYVPPNRRNPGLPPPHFEIKKILPLCSPKAGPEVSP